MIGIKKQIYFKEDSVLKTDLTIAVERLKKLFQIASLEKKNFG